MVNVIIRATTSYHAVAVAAGGGRTTYSNKFLSKAACQGRTKKRFSKITSTGKIIRGRLRAPVVAGQVGGREGDIDAGRKSGS